MHEWQAVVLRMPGHIKSNTYLMESTTVRRWSYITRCDLLLVEWGKQEEEEADKAQCGKALLKTCRA